MMEVKLKKLEDQVVVITGASSGIGLVTARKAAARGAKLVVAARAEEALRRLVEEINSKGGEAVYVVTDALRMELEAEGAPVSVTLVKPGTIDTPYREHAKNLLEKEPTLPPPAYAPETVADAIVHCAETPVRDVYVGASAKALSLAGKYAPRLTDKAMETFMFGAQQQGEPARGDRHRGLYEASGELKERSGEAGLVLESSLYTKASLHPVLTGALVVGAGVAAAALLRPRRTGGGGNRRARA